MRSENFEVYSSAGEGNTRETLRIFERVRSFFLQATKRSEGKEAPVYIVGFNSDKEYAPYRINEFAAAYYHPGADRDYIVMGRVGNETFPVAVHEYVHLVVRHAGLNFPPWLNEGLAELYSTLKPRGNQIMMGDLIPARRYALLTEKWVPLATILEADRDSPYYNEKNKAGSLYNEGWGLVHMLALSEDYRLKFPDFLAAMQDGASSQTALEKIYGKPLAAVEKELQGYLRGDSFRAVLFPVKLETTKEAFPAESAQSLDVDLLLADLNNRPGKEKDAQARLEQLARENPQRPEPWAGLAYLAWAAGNSRQAEENFAKAFTLGDRNPRMLWDYGRLAEREHPEQASEALNALLVAEPERTEARFELAALKLQTQKPGEALMALNPIHNVTIAQAPRLFTLTAYVQLQLRQLDAARAAVERLAQYAKAPEDVAALESLRRYLDRPASGAAPVPATLAPEPLPSRDLDTVGQEVPRLVRRTQLRDGSIVRQYATTPSVSGTFVEFQCTDTQPRIVMETDQGKKMFVIEDPEKIVIVGREGGKVDLQCGAQQRLPIRVEFSPASVPGLDGSVQVLYFEK